MKNYTPYVITTMSKETGQEWLKTAEDYLKIVEDNDAKYKHILDQMPVFRLPEEH